MAASIPLLHRAPSKARNTGQRLVTLALTMEQSPSYSRRSQLNHGQRRRTPERCNFFLLNYILYLIKIYYLIKVEIKYTLQCAMTRNGDGPPLQAFATLKTHYSRGPPLPG